MRVMGVDLSSRSLAMVLLDKSGHRIAFAKYKVPDKIKDRQQIAKSLFEDGLSFVSESYPDVVYIEEPVVAGKMNLRSSLLIAQICGVMMSVCAASGMEHVYLVPVSSWKKGSVGSGNADKQRVSTWLNENHPKIASICGRDQDLIDAACIAIYGQGLQCRLDAVRSGLSHGTQLS